MIPLVLDGLFCTPNVSKNSQMLQSFTRTLNFRIILISLEFSINETAMGLQTLQCTKRKVLFKKIDWVMKIWSNEIKGHFYFDVNVHYLMTQRNLMDHEPHTAAYRLASRTFFNGTSQIAERCTQVQNEVVSFINCLGFQNHLELTLYVF